MSNLRIFNTEEFYDSMTFDESYLANLKDVIQVFDRISGGHVFDVPA